MENLDLLENYVEFLKLFRGSVERREDRIEISSDRPEFKMLVPLRGLPTSDIAGFSGAVISLPWIEPAVKAISDSGLSRKNEIVFMSKCVGPSSPQIPPQVRVAESLKDLEAFSLVQGRGFLENEKVFNDWHPWLKAANVRNHGNAKCKFLIAELDGVPASVTLLVETDKACGIYAVATPPEFRKKGLSTLLLNASEIFAKESGYEEVCLQVNVNTYAQSFYERLGFKEDYRIGIFK